MYCAYGLWLIVYQLSSNSVYHGIRLVPFLGPLIRFCNPSVAVFLQMCRISSLLLFRPVRPSLRRRLLFPSWRTSPSSWQLATPTPTVLRPIVSPQRPPKPAPMPAPPLSLRVIVSAPRVPGPGRMQRTQVVLRGPDPPPPPPRDDNVLHTYVNAQAHAAVATLHAQAVAVLNIKSMIPVLLDNLSPNYSRWKVLFLNTLGKYELIDHVLVDPFLLMSLIHTGGAWIALSGLGSTARSLLTLSRSPRCWSPRPALSGSAWKSSSSGIVKPTP
jgi:hypothetical protein